MMKVFVAIGLAAAFLTLATATGCAIAHPEGMTVCEKCLTEEQILALARKQVQADGYDPDKVRLVADWNGRIWYVHVDPRLNTPGAHFAYEYSTKGELLRTRGGA
jgi:hypothetical protein